MKREAEPSPERPLTLALPQGRIRDEALAIFARAGIDLSLAEKSKAGRKLLIPIESEGLRVWTIIREVPDGNWGAAGQQVRFQQLVEAAAKERDQAGAPA